MKLNKSKLFICMSSNEMTFKQLSDVSNVSRATLSAINNGKNCSPVTAGKIANALNVDIKELIED